MLHWVGDGESLSLGGYVTNSLSPGLLRRSSLEPPPVVQEIPGLVPLKV